MTTSRTPAARLEHVAIFLWSEIEAWGVKHMGEIRPQYSEPMMTDAEAAARIGVHVGSVYRWIDRGRLSATTRKPALDPCARGRGAPPHKATGGGVAGS